MSQLDLAQDGVLKYLINAINMTITPDGTGELAVKGLSYYSISVADDAKRLGIIIGPRGQFFFITLDTADSASPSFPGGVWKTPSLNSPCMHLAAIEISVPAQCRIRFRTVASMFLKLYPFVVGLDVVG